jgi:hypothetical protein
MPIIVDALFLATTPVPLLKLILIIFLDIEICIKCLVLWRCISCPSQIKDVEESSNAQYDEENPSGLGKGMLIPPSLTIEQKFASGETPKVGQGPCQKEMTEIETSKQRPSEGFGNPEESLAPKIRG